MSGWFRTAISLEPSISPLNRGKLTRHLKRAWSLSGRRPIFLDRLRQIALRRCQAALRSRKTRFGLGNVGSGHLAHFEPVTRCAQIPA